MAHLLTTHSATDVASMFELGGGVDALAMPKVSAVIAHKDEGKVCAIGVANGEFEGNISQVDVAKVVVFDALNMALDMWFLTNNETVITGNTAISSTVHEGHVVESGRGRGNNMVGEFD